MTVRTKATLKGYFNTGDVPSETNLADLIDSLQRQAVYDVRDYGAVGNGTDDDTTAIQAAIDAAAAAGGGIVDFPIGTWLVSTINLKRYVSLRGSATSQKSLLSFTGSPGLFTTTILSNQTISNLGFTHTAIVGANKDFIKISYGITGCIFNGLFFYGKAASTRHGLWILAANPDSGAENNTYFNTFSDFTMQISEGTEVIGCAIRLEGSGTPNYYGVNNNTFINIVPTSWSTSFYINGAGNQFIGGQIPRSSVAGFHFYGYNETLSNTIMGIYFDGSWSVGDMLLLESTGTSIQTMVNVVACTNFTYAVARDIHVFGYILLAGTNKANIRYSAIGQHLVTQGVIASGVSTFTSTSNDASVPVRAGDYFIHTLTENTSLSDYYSDQYIIPGTGRKITIKLIQATGSGPFTVGAGNLFKFAPTYTMSTGAGDIDILTFMWDGVNWLESGRSQNVG